MSNKINFKIGYSVDKNSINEIQKSLISIKKLTTSDLMKLDQSLGLEAANKKLKEIQSSAEDVQKALDNSFNKDLGTLNISKFRDQLKTLDVASISRDFSSVNASGGAAFRNIATQVMTTNTQLKESHKILDEMAYTMKNTVKWWVSSNIMNTTVGRLQEAYGYVKNLDSSLNNIRIVTGKNAEEMADFAVQANKAATALRTPTTEYTESSYIYALQGLADKEIAARTETTLKAANVTRQSAAAVSEQLTSV